MKANEILPHSDVIKIMDDYYGVSSPIPEIPHAPKIKHQKKKKSKKNLSILIATFWDFPHTGGLSNYISNLRDGLQEEGHEVDVISPNQFPTSVVASLKKEVESALNRLFRKRYKTISKKILQHARLLFIYEHMLAKHKNIGSYDVYHAQDVFTANVLGRLIGKKKPVFYTPHGMFTSNRLRFNRIEKGSIEEVYYTHMEKKAIQYSNEIIILGDSFRKPLMALGARNEKMITIPTGIQFNVTAAKRDKSNSNKLTITIISRLGPRKGHSVFFKALSLIKDSLDNVEVLIVGDGEMRSQLENQVKESKLSNVTFLGKREDIPDLLGRTDIFVLPTLNDTLPVSIMEAMHSKVAILSTTSGSIPEMIIHGETGLLVEPGDVKALSNALKQFIQQPHEREKMAKAAYQYAKQHFSRERMIYDIENRYGKHVGGDIK
ncbi:glycosyltransferase family 4 protein [Pontibacillus yanchengensis]|uniref:Glycogen synthase n=1 Tax=Pontibacillus yanchengensis Y32 TaxID=1385514 RepID=A0A0A2TVR1_9BACI|nr:glycosyltransferase family 4 protein [Pontibacillus yanchengensis]KGP73335.1 glycogen synthase [Pontibacillus yanchengensis Y32]